MEFKFTIPEDIPIKIENDSTFENFAGQFQTFSSKILCVVDGSQIRFYEKDGRHNLNLRFEYKTQRTGWIEYYFREILTDSLYCFFGYDAAKIMYPRLHEFVERNHAEGTRVVIAPAPPVVVTVPNKLTISICNTGERRRRLLFPNFDYPVTCVTRELFN